MMGSFDFLKKAPQHTQKTVSKRLIEKSYAWHAHNHREVLATLGVNESGLDEGEVSLRRKRYGSNVFTQHEPRSIFRVIFTQLTSPLTVVLLFACFLTIFLKEYVDAFVISIALAIAVCVGVMQEGKASRAFERLSSSQVHIATVIRRGKKHQIPASGLVPGDIVEFEAGMYVPADLRLIKTKLLTINEATLTGEWMAVSKQVKAVHVGTPFAEQSDMAWMGTFVSEGYGQGVVVKTGDKTAVGTLAHDLGDIQDEETPLQAEMKKISKTMLYIIIGVIVIIFSVGVYKGVGIPEMLLMSVAVAVASVPEGLPAAVTIVLAIGMEVLLKRGGLVRNLLAAETLGSTTYILTDKTGTLTEGIMAVDGLIYDHTTNLAPDTWKDIPHANRLLDVALCATNAFVDPDEEEDEYEFRGDPVEVAILTCAQSVGIDYEKGSLRAERLDFMGFTSHNRFAAGLVETEDTYRLCINGAPEYILENATHLQREDGLCELDEDDKEKILEEMEKQTKEGKRLVAVAYKDVSYNDIPEEGDASTLIEECVFMGVLIFSDPVRKGVRDAIYGMKEAGAQIVLVTGDNEDTALSIARRVGIAGAHEVAFSGQDLEGLSDEEVLGILDEVHVFARVLPKQKLRLAQVLQMSGEIVAMTGDGINDAPALRKAHIGIALGSGTEVAKEASDLVLVNDTLATMYAAIEEGRRVVTNLRKIVGYLLATSFTEVALISTALIVGSAIPILPVQILWANIIEEGLMSVAFAFDKSDKDSMKRSPQDIHEEGILSRAMLYFLSLVIATLSVISVVLYLYLKSLDLPLETIRSAMFLSVAVDSLFVAFAFRSLTVPVWRISLTNNMFFILAFLLSTLLLILAVTVPFMQNLLSYTPLPWHLIALVLAFGVGGLLVVEVAKALFWKKG